MHSLFLFFSLDCHTPNISYDLWGFQDNKAKRYICIILFVFTARQIVLFWNTRADWSCTTGYKSHCSSLCLHIVKYHADSTRGVYCALKELYLYIVVWTKPLKSCFTPSIFFHFTLFAMCTDWSKMLIQIWKNTRKLFLPLLCWLY